MGCHTNIDIDRFPKQGSFLGKDVNVCFFYNSDVIIKGRVVRDDAEDPFKLIIQLEDGRYVEAGECQYQIIQ